MNTYIHKKTVFPIVEQELVLKLNCNVTYCFTFYYMFIVYDKHVMKK